MLLNQKELANIEGEVEKFSDWMMEMGCDSIRIIATASPKPGETACVSTGRGNWLAQLGSIKNWVEEQDDARRAAANRGNENGSESSI